MMIFLTVEASAVSRGYNSKAVHALVSDICLDLYVISMTRINYIFYQFMFLSYRVNLAEGTPSG